MSMKSTKMPQYKVVVKPTPSVDSRGGIPTPDEVARPKALRCRVACRQAKHPPAVLANPPQFLPLSLDVLRDGLA